ncbi:MAG: flavodoxin family protein [Planctomycetes bacterium]|nr:flavodoxin family protein [Planctomycetota bacterium]MBM4087197.1 flavodoxin family protein [Planctomycetota bacterium]
MSIKVLGISSSPRAGGNSDTLLKEALRGAESAGAACESVALRDRQISPCVECNACYKTGVCRVQDDYQPLFQKMLEADRLVFATPIFFMAVCAQGKLLIDRCQCLWARKYVLKQPLFSPPRPNRHALVIAVGGSKSEKMFECIRLTMKYYFDVLEMKYAGNLFFNRVDGYGDVEKHPKALTQAFEAGRRLALLSDEPEGSIMG